MALGHEVRSEERDARRADLPIPEEAQQGGRSAFSYIDVSLVRSGAEKGLMKCWVYTLRIPRFAFPSS